jgi:mycofactocin precursor
MSVQVTPSVVVVEGTTTDEVSAVDAVAAAGPDTANRLIESDLLVEDVSIDGMCGVY